MSRHVAVEDTRDGQIAGHDHGMAESRTIYCKEDVAALIMPVKVGEANASHLA